MRILAIDDDPDILDFLVEGLAQFEFTVDTAETGEKGLAIAQGGSYDMILLDVGMPGMSGVEVARKLRESGNTVLITMVTALNAEDDVVAGLEAGADGYVTKPFSIKELAARVTALARRMQTSGQEPLVFGDLSVNEARRTARRNGKPLRLTETEFRLLAHFLRNPGEDVTREVLLKEVWGMDFDPGTGVVDVHLGNLRRKLRTLGPPVIQTVRGVGFRLANGE